MDSHISISFNSSADIGDTVSGAFCLLRVDAPSVKVLVDAAVGVFISVSASFGLSELECCVSTANASSFSSVCL